MGNGASATQYKLCSSKHVHRNSRDYHDVMAKVRSTTADPRKRSRDGYKYVTGDTLMEAPVENNYATSSDNQKATRGNQEHVITDGETLLFSDGGNPFVVVPESDRENGRRQMTSLNERLIHVDVDVGNKKVQDRSFMVGVMD